MSDYEILQHCSPTLAGIKQGNLFTSSYTDKKEVVNAIRRLNALLAPKGIRVIPLRYHKGRVLIYLYRPAELKECLGDPEVRKILNMCGYKSESDNGCLSTLIRKLKNTDVFPHEIGVFLGYPTKDVEGFIKFGGRDCKYSGVWKVYDDVETSKHKFEMYRHCTRIYCDAGRRGRSLDQLTVSRA